MPYLTGYGNLSQAEYDAKVAEQSTAASLPTASAGQVAQDDAGVTTTQQQVQTGQITADQATQSAYVATNGSGTGDTLTTTNSQATPATVPVIQAADTNRDATATVNDVDRKSVV